MSHTYSLTPDSEADIHDAHAWYELQQIGRGDEFIVELKERIRDICDSPLIFGRVRRAIRAAMLPKSQFIIYFRIEQSNIVITAIQHARAHPNKWKRRK